MKGKKKCVENDVLYKQYPLLSGKHNKNKISDSDRKAVLKVTATVQKVFS